MLTVEVVSKADQRRRWHEVGRVLFTDEPRWAPPLASYERWLFSRRHPWLRSGAEVTRLLARRQGRVVGRIAVHVHPSDTTVARFGGFECDDDVDAVRALVEQAGEWSVERGAQRLSGPALYTPDDGDAGVLVAGFDHPGATGRPWHPERYSGQLQAAGLEAEGEPIPRWRLRVEVGPSLPRGGEVPPHAGRLVDPALVLAGGSGAIAAVPDVTAVARGTRVRRPSPTEASVVRCEGDPAVLVPALLAAAAIRGYDHVWAPWFPDRERPPDTVHRLFGQNLR